MVDSSNSTVREAESLLSSRQNVHQPWYACARNCCTPQFRSVRSKAAMLVIVWTFLTFISYSNPAYLTLGPIESLPEALRLAIVLAIGVVTVIGPLAGLAASAYFSRYKVERAALWLMWAGNTAAVAILILKRFFPDSQQILYYTGILIAIVTNFSGGALFLVNSIPFGLDQMPGASGEQISAFIHWYVWAALAGLATDSLISTIRTCTKSVTPDTDILISLFSAASLSVALCSFILLRHWLTIEPSGTNPLKTIFRVLKFAVKHKRPIRRSAFTYCEDDKPSRIDLGKSKYGGPFTNEEVEDVKACLRMVVVIGSITATVVPLFAWVLSVPKMHHAEFIYTYLEYTCKDETVQLGLCLGLGIILILPVYEVITRIILIRKCVSSIMRRVGSAQILMACTSLILLVLTTVWYIHYHPTTCMLTTFSDTSPLSIDHNWVDILTNTLLCLSIFLCLTAMLEFVCAQAPYNLRGLLIGILYSVLLCSIFLGEAVHTIWKTAYQHNRANSSSCGVWFYLFTTIATTLGCLLWCAVAKWYKKRERDEPEMCRIYAENYYDH